MRAALRPAGLALALATILLFGTGTIAPLPTHAATEGLSEVSRSTFRLVPGRERVDVEVRLSITNRQPSSVRIVPCPGNLSLRCRQRISYYTEEWGYVVVQDSAERVRFSGRGVRARIDSRKGPWRFYKVRFDRIFQGQTRDIRVTYRLPAGPQWSESPTRVLSAYAHFCWHGQPADKGTVTAVLPRGYETQTHGGAVREKRTRKSTTVTARTRANPARFYGCTEAFDVDDLVSSEATTSAGQRLLVQGWPEHPDWAATVSDGLVTTLPQLESIIGIGFPREDVVIRQVASQALGGYAGDFTPRSGQIRIGENLDDRVLVAHELAHAWFNGATLADLWAIEGLAEWAGTRAAEEDCPESGEFPGKGSPRLRKWHRVGADPDRIEQDAALVQYQYAAACHIVGGVADRMGEERMRDVIVALLLRTPKYGGATSGAAGAPAPSADADAPIPDWREWLDAVDELGLVPAGETDLRFAEEVLLAQGVARPKDLRGRADARTAYHAASAGPLQGAMPPLASRLMDEWRFDRAMEVLAVAEEAVALIEEAETAGHDGEVVASLRSRLVAADGMGELRAVLADVRVLGPSA